MLGMWSKTVFTITKTIFEMLITSYCNTSEKVHCLESSQQYWCLPRCWYSPRMYLMWKDGFLIIFDLILKNQWPCFLFSPICNTVNFDCGCSFCTIYWVTRYNKWHKCYILWRILTVFSQKKFRLYPDLMFPFCFQNSQ